MIEFLIDGGGFITVNPVHIVYIKNDSGQALVHLTNGNVILAQLAYDDLLTYFLRSGVNLTLDGETRDDIEATEDEE